MEEFFLDRDRVGCLTELSPVLLLHAVENEEAEDIDFCDWESSTRLPLCG